MRNQPNLPHSPTPETAPRTTVMTLVNGHQAGDAESQFVALARSLDKSRFRVLVTSLSHSTLLEDELRGSDVEVRSVGARGRWGVGALFGLASLLRRERVDVLQTMGSPATGVGLLAAKIVGTPVRIVTERGRSESGPWHALEERLVRSATGVVVDSEKAARKAIDKGTPAERVTVIYEGVPTESLRTSGRERQAVRSEHGVLDESWLIGVGGGLTADIDLGSFLQAASIVRSEIPGTKFMFLGEGQQRSELQRRATILGLDGSVIFAGTQPNSAAYVAAMDVAVMPGGPVDASGFGLQAMGLGRPIVAADTGSTAELFPMGDAGLIIPPNNPIILAHAILELMKHPDGVDRMRERGREIFGERYTMARMIRSYEELYADLWASHEAKRVAADANPVRNSR